MSWQPIKSAPKDGTWILVYYKDELHESQSHTCVMRFLKRDWVSDEGMLQARPDFWQPLPPPPAE